MDSLLSFPSRRGSSKTLTYLLVYLTLLTNLDVLVQAGSSSPRKRGFSFIKLIKSFQNWPGGYSIGETHDPIPNSNVKPNRADGTLSYGMGE